MDLRLEVVEKFLLMAVSEMIKVNFPLKFLAQKFQIQKN